MGNTLFFIVLYLSGKGMIQHNNADEIPSDTIDCSKAEGSIQSVPGIWKQSCWLQKEIIMLAFLVYW